MGYLTYEPYGSIVFCYNIVNEVLIIHLANLLH